MSLPKPLMFTVGLIDQITKPIAKISQQFNGLASNYQAGTMQMATGVGGIAASGYALYEALQPAIEIDRALGNAKGVGVADSALKQITNTAMDFSLQFGKSSVDVINHAEKLRGVMGAMPDDVLVSATRSSATLAMAMKSDADTVTKYFKNLYGNYGDQANAMGQDRFIAQMAGMTAHAKKAFGTELSELEGMIDGMHSLPSTLGVAVEEQFAVMSMLNKQMGQGDAVTQYTNYLEKIVASQDKLGVKLTDSNGRMLPIVDTLETLKPLLVGKSGDQAWKFLDDAGLGDGSLMIINMLKNLDGLKTNINSFKNVKGLEPATEMAQAMTDQSERLSQSWFVIRAALGSAVLPAFNEFVGWIADMGKDVLWFTQTFPNLTRVLGYAAIGILGLVAAGGALTVMVGVSKMAMTSWSLVTDLAAWSGKRYTATLAWMRGAIIGASINTQLFMATIKATTAYQWAASVATAAWGTVTTGITATLGTLRNVMVGVNAVMLANPIGLIVAGIALAVTAVGALIYYWDDLKATMSEWTWLQQLLGWFNTVWTDIKNGAIDAINYIIEKLNMLPGVEIDVIPNVAGLEQQPQLPEFIQSNNQQAVPSWMQQTAANDGSIAALMNGPWLNDSVMSTTPVNQGGLAPDTNITRLSVEYQQGTLPPVTAPPMVQAVEMQRNALPPYQPEQVTQQLDIKPVANETMASAIKPRINQQAAMSAKASRVASQSNSKSLSFGDVIINNSHKNLSLAEIADQQELMTG